MNALKLLTDSVLREVPDHGRVIDVGAGLEAPYQIGLLRRCSRLVMVDAHQPYLDANQIKGPNVAKICGVVPEALHFFGEADFDVAVAIDFIEHLEKETALQAIGEMKRIADKVVIFTPEGVHPQDHDVYMMGADFWQTHKSTWEMGDLVGLGFDVQVWGNFHPDVPGKSRNALWGVWKKS